MTENFIDTEGNPIHPWGTYIDPDKWSGVPFKVHGRTHVEPLVITATLLDGHGLHFSSTPEQAASWVRVTTSEEARAIENIKHHKKVAERLRSLHKQPPAESDDALLARLFLNWALEKYPLLGFFSFDCKKTEHFFLVVDYRQAEDDEHYDIPWVNDRPDIAAIRRHLKEHGQ